MIRCLFVEESTAAAEDGSLSFFIDDFEELLAAELGALGFLLLELPLLVELPLRKILSNLAEADLEDATELDNDDPLARCPLVREEDAGLEIFDDELNFFLELEEASFVSNLLAERSLWNPFERSLEGFFIAEAVTGDEESEEDALDEVDDEERFSDEVL